METNPDQVAESAVEEWDYRETESQYTDDTFSTSVPCQLKFTDNPQQDTERFHDALRVHGYTPLDPSPANLNKAPYYDGEIASADHHRRVRVLVFRGYVVRLYPHDEYVPSNEELAEIIHALSTGFKSPLRHQPIEN